ncbi:hypothetical protein [Bailinhaonella thermotolerans]|uniref:Uncharacterized protein n=1 Tax=Bailinhaonella thermotolerans TaxID=1070861 RepID=A0A3A4B392_9ACTN|nr:hypothetical protein [Bailinhaonella thermotolerans]RJL31860.1 hypothetical protein D5H75_15465 [Bailinhaonella thermotolerans]
MNVFAASARPARSSLLSPLLAHWDGSPGYRRFAYVVGAALIATGVLHAGFGLATGAPVEGPLSWRKPATFGFSFGLTTVTLGWVSSCLRVRPWAGWTGAVLLCASTVVEVAWVALQHARGVPSHFNFATGLDEALLVGAGVAIGVTNLVIAAMTVAVFVLATVPAPMAWALRAGMVSLLTAQLVGLWMINHGTDLSEAGFTPLTRELTVYGAAGAMKVAHAVPMHAIQALTVLAGALAFSGLAVRRQLALVVSAILGYALLVGVVLARTAAGLPPITGLTWPFVAAYVLAAGLLAVPAAVAARGAVAAVRAVAARAVPRRR